MRLAFRVPLGFTVLVLVGGCGGGGNGTTGPTPDSACTALAAATCAKLDLCVKNGVASRYGDMDTCQTRQKTLCVTALGANGTGQTPEHELGCAMAIPAATCQDDINGNIAACQAPPGKFANGKACTYNAQCQSAICSSTRGTNCGICSDPSTAGADCSAQACSRGFECVTNNATSTQTCQPVTYTAGGACGATAPCGSELNCVGSTMTTMGTCQTQVGTMGAACDPRAQTGPRCQTDQGLFCDGTSKTCVAVPYNMPGGACGFDRTSGMDALCTGASDCFGAGGGTQGTCTALAADGAGCDTANGPSCMAPARCVTGGGTSTTGTCAVADPTMCM
jgi:hypothetical protein